MRRRITVSLALFGLTVLPLHLQVDPASGPSFEVATITPTPPDFRGRYTRMLGAHQFEARGYTLKYMVAASYTVPLRSISGGPSWIDEDRYDIRAATPGESRPTTDQQMAMLRHLLADRFRLTMHLEPRELPVDELTVAPGGVTLKESAAGSRESSDLVNRVFPDHVRLPARNATITELAAMMQRAVLDRHVIDKTGLNARYDFDLEWTPDDTQFGGQLPLVPSDNPKPDLFAAVRQQLGLRLQATRARVDTIVIDRVERPS
jgi:uncharacterized protein (TIGR03435 family)